MKLAERVKSFFRNEPLDELAKQVEPVPLKREMGAKETVDKLELGCKEAVDKLALECKKTVDQLDRECRDAIDRVFDDWIERI